MTIATRLPRPLRRAFQQLQDSPWSSRDIINIDIDDVSIHGMPMPGTSPHVSTYCFVVLDRVGFVRALDGMVMRILPEGGFREDDVLRVRFNRRGEATIIDLPHGRYVASLEGLQDVEERTPLKQRVPPVPAFARPAFSLTAQYPVPTGWAATWASTERRPDRYRFASADGRVVVALELHTQTELRIDIETDNLALADTLAAFMLVSADPEAKEEEAAWRSAAMFVPFEPLDAETLVARLRFPLPADLVPTATPHVEVYPIDQILDDPEQAAFLAGRLDESVHHTLDGIEHRAWRPLLEHLQREGPVELTAAASRVLTKINATGSGSHRDQSIGSGSRE